MVVNLDNIRFKGHLTRKGQVHDRFSQQIMQVFSFSLLSKIFLSKFCFEKFSFAQNSSAMCLSRNHRVFISAITKIHIEVSLSFEILK